MVASRLPCPARESLSKRHHKVHMDIILGLKLRGQRQDGQIRYEPLTGANQVPLGKGRFSRNASVPASASRTQARSGSESSNVTPSKNLTPTSYAGAIQRLMNRKVWRTVGDGTDEDPTIHWVYNITNCTAARIHGCETVIREACEKMKTPIVWVRAIDHSVTRKPVFSPAENRHVMLLYPSDPHITVYMGTSIEYVYEGHLFCAYSSINPDVPERLAKPGERLMDEEGEGLSIVLWDRTDIRDKAYKEKLLPLASCKDGREENTAIA
ncbi:hypothetical protein BJX61DRAFT_547342 [Aspergillus egyptiacus]|nr:hypothetical protein BJX61DRAFT_547342 [Aspergillus egyptiacus]